MTDHLSKYHTKFNEEWMGFNPTLMFIVVCVVYGVLLFAKRVFIIDTIAAFEILNERGDIWVFDIVYSIQYFSIPVFLAWKLTWTTLLLWIGSFMFGYRLHFNRIWKMVLLMETLFFLPEIIKIVWFTVFDSNPEYQDYVAFYPLSLINLFDYTQLDQKWHYPLKVVNLFELCYIPMLILGIYFMSGKSLRISSLIVLTTYAPFFLLWLGFYVLVY